MSFVKGLEQCVHLEELILNDNLVKKVEGLDLCVCTTHNHTHTHTRVCME